MCNGIAIIVVKQSDEVKVYCDPTNGSHDKLLSENVPVEYHNSYIKIEYIYPGELKLDCPDKECIESALKTEMVELAGINNVVRIKPVILSKIAGEIPEIKSWPKELMQCANLRDANLRNANLRNANLRDANLRNADLRDANLRNADLQYADLRNADLLNANLLGANLWNANLWNANLQGADLWNADLWNANLPDPVGGKFDPAKINEYREKLGIIIENRG